MSNDKSDIAHTERLEHVDEVHDQGYSVDAEELPHGYFTSPLFVGTFIACGMNLAASTGGFALVAPVIGSINVAIGPSKSIIWLALVYTVCLAVGLTLVGRLSDLFGRRWFFIGGTLLGMIGAIIGATAKTVPVLIGGETLIGLSACTGYSYAFVIGELVPVKHRFLANAVIFAFSIPTAGFGAAVSTAFILYTKAGWRWVYYLLIILNGVTAVLYALFYYPPTFHMKHGSSSISTWIKNFDFVGLVLYIAGLALFILGLASGGDGLYPWKSPQVISFIVVGFFCLVSLAVYESKVKLSEPLIPVHLFKDRGYVAATISLSLGASVYYSQAIIWPGMAANVYGQDRPMWAGWVATLVGLGITVGEMIGGGLAKPLGRTKWQCIVMFSLGTLFLGLMAVNTIDTPTMAMALVFFASAFIGYNEALVLPICSIRIRDQQEIGTAVGVAGSVRSAISTIASTIYSTVLATRLGQTIPNGVPPALISAGLPAASVPAYLEAIAAGGTAAALAAVDGLTPTIQVAGALAYRVAYLQAYRTIFFVSIGMGVVGIIATCFVPNIDDQMTGGVAATVQSRKDGETLGEKYHHKAVDADMAPARTMYLVRSLDYTLSFLHPRKAALLDNRATSMIRLSQQLQPF
ncbi:hypothetical protein LTR17_017946 [Elasticomyces elasticus]|nr:hypothetical protein LTR17_017946 [Elasticomyces elasticus]